MFKEYGTEIKVGALTFAALAMAGVFMWLLGDYTPLASTYNIYVDYNFAGGVELGTPVRVSGVKVGKVTRIDFLDPGVKDASGVEIAIRLKLNVSKKVDQKVRADSKFYINQAGIIGERYVEITPGSSSSEVVKPNAIVRGIDPPRFDQLLSQGMGFFGELNQILEDNREGIEKAAKAMGRAGDTLDAFATKITPADMDRLHDVVVRLDHISGDAEMLVSQLRRELGPTLDSVRVTLRTAQPLLARADRLLKEVENVVDNYNDLPPERRKEIEKTMSDMVETAQRLQAVVERLDKFTAMVEHDYSDMDRKKIEESLRSFLQDEGIRVNVGEVHIK